MKWRESVHHYKPLARYYSPERNPSVNFLLFYCLHLYTVHFWFSFMLHNFVTRHGFAFIFGYAQKCLSVQSQCVSLQLLVQNWTGKWQFPLNFCTLCKLSIYIWMQFWNIPEILNNLDVHLVWTTSETWKIKNLTILFFI